MRSRWIVCLVVFLAPALAGSTPSDKEVARLRKLAETYEQRGRMGDAVLQLHEALSLAPRNTAVLGDLLRMTGGQRDEFSLWAHHLARRATGEKGIFRNSKALPKDAARAIQPILKIAPIRAGVVDRLAAQAKRLRRTADAPAAHYLWALWRACTRDVPALRAKHETRFQDAIARCTPEGADVLGKLERAMKKAWGEGRDADAMRAAHILRGVCVQARRTKLEVRRLEAMETAAILVMRKIRKEAAAASAPVTIAALLAIPPAERPAWEAAHSDWTNPTVVLSPNERYRIESVCGVRTTLMAALDVEYCHARLVKWFGRDPFLKVQGTVRLCRSPADLEGEGQPHYWAGGFQAGHLTAVIVHASSRGGLAKTLTHELTHRFDGAILPGMPGWLVEGRAVYTAGGSLWPRAETVDPRPANFGALYHAGTKGYGGKEKLTKLIEGRPDEYRDNYKVGYALWIYLTRFRKELYGARVPAYLKSFRGKPGWPAMQRFGHFFLDGKKGRGKSFDEFVRDFRKFIDEGGSIDTVAWKKAWRAEQRVAYGQASREQRTIRMTARGELESPYDREILDKSNWQTFRNRSDDPTVGEKHAYAAGLWFESQKMRDAAVQAFAWARAVDELTADQLLHVADLHARLGKPAAAWLHRLAARARALEDVELGHTPAPVVQLQQILQPLLRALKLFEKSYRDQALKRAARALLADRVLLSRAAGIDPGAYEDDAEPLGTDRLPPDCEAFESVLDGGLVEEYWAPAESRLNRSYHIGRPGLLVMGRRKPAKGETSGFTRDAGVRRTFVRGTQWYDGTYTLRVRVKFISAHLGAAIVLGHTRKDRGLILHIRGGDWAYAVGRKDEGVGFPNISLRLDDLRSYDGGVSIMGRSVSFRTPRTSCEVTVHVSGSFLQVLVDGEEVRTHRTATGLPIEGRIGFYLGSGQVAFDRPEVRRHRAIGPMATCPCRHADEPIDLTRPSRLSWHSWPGRRVKGVERHPLGTLLVLFPESLWKNHDADMSYDLWTVRLGEPTARQLRVLHPKGAVVPKAWPEKIRVPHAGLPNLQALREEWFQEEADRAVSRNRDPNEEAALERLREEGAVRSPWAAVDSRGIVRSCDLGLTDRGSGYYRALLYRLRGW